MNDRPLTLAIITGSVRAVRLGPIVANWFADRARQHGRYRVDAIDLADHDVPRHLPGSLEELLTTEGRSEPMRELATRLEAADAFVVVTPEYNHSYPGALKDAIDWHLAQWRAKPIGFVSYGGLSGGSRAVEHLRSVFAEVHATTIRDTVSFPVVWEQLSADGELEVSEDAEVAAKILLDQLAWWGEALRAARERAPYELGA